MQIVIYTLLNYMNTCIKQDTNYEIAKCLLLNIQKISKMSLEDTALLCNVSVSTLTRFFRTVGFYNFSTIKRLLKNQEYPFDQNSFVNHHNSEEYIEDIAQGLYRLENIDSEKLMNIAKWIDQAPHIYMLGYGDFHYQAAYFQNIMLYHGKLLEIIHQNEQFKPAKLEPEDMLLITSLSGKYVKNIETTLKKCKCRKILITQMNDMHSDFDCVLEMGINQDKNLDKYFIMRIYEKIISSYCFHKSSHIMASK